MRTFFQIIFITTAMVSLLLRSILFLSGMFAGGNPCRQIFNFILGGVPLEIGSNLKTIYYKELSDWIFDRADILVISEDGARAVCALLSLRGEYLLVDEEVEGDMMYMHIPGFSEPIRMTFEEVVREAREIYSHELHRTEEHLRKLRGVEYGSYRKIYEQLLNQGRELSMIEVCSKLKEVRV